MSLKLRSLRTWAPALLAGLLPSCGADSSSPASEPLPVAPLVAPKPPPVITPKCGPMDVVFILDDTGSMSGALASVQAGINTIINDIVTVSGGNYQLGLISLKDTGGWGQDNVRVIDDLAPGNAAAIINDVNSLSAWGGAGWPEISDEALNTAVNNLPAAGRPQTNDFNGTWRSGATKLVIMVTDAPPAGLDDTYTPGVDDVNAHNFALQAAAAGIAIDAIYVPTSGVSSIITSVMQDYASTTGGIYTQTDAAGTGTATAIHNNILDCGGSKPSDVWIMDNSTDTSAEPNPNWNIYTSPDIRVCNGLAGCAGFQNPIASFNNQVFVTLRNNGYGVSPPAQISGQVHLYWTAAGGAASWPSSWNFIGSAPMSLAPGQVAETPGINWIPPGSPSHFCLLARWVSQDDPMTFPETTVTVFNTINNNNIGWRNVDTVHTIPDHPVDIPFRLENVHEEPRVTGLKFTAEGAAEAPDQVGVTVDLGEELFARWLEAGGQGAGVEMIGGTRLFLAEPAKASIDGLLLDKRESRTVTVTFVQQNGEIEDKGTLTVSQHEANEETGETMDVGGVRHDLRLHRFDAPPVAPVLGIDLLAGDSPALAWTHALQNVKYEIWRSRWRGFAAGDDTAELVDTVSATDDNNGFSAVRYVDKSVSVASGYFYLVRALNAFGEYSESSNVTDEALPGN